LGSNRACAAPSGVNAETGNRGIFRRPCAGTPANTHALEGSAVNEDRFRYVEQAPPLTGKERRADYMRQYMRWRYATDADFRASQKLTAKTQRDAGYFRDYYARKRQRTIAVAREYGAALALAVGLLLPAVAQAQEQPVTPKCPSLRDVSTVLREQFKESPVATWLDQGGDIMTLFAGEAGKTTTLVISRGECAAILGEGLQLRTWAIVGGEEA
jgi:hypothetical protein